MPRSNRSSITAALTAAAVLASSLIAPLSAPAPAAQAADGAPAITLEASSPASVLYGRDVPVTLTATNADGPDAYNLGFREVLPADTTLGGATIGGQPIAPSSQQRLSDGRTVVTWTNVADLLQGASVALEYTIVPGRSTYVIDTSVGQQSTALASADPRALPRLDGAGAPVAGTGLASDSAQTRIAAFEIEKSEPSPESELLRGAHAHQTVYTLTVTNNDVIGTSGFSIVDFLPAGLEFLGCGAVDNTPDQAPEHDGSGSLAVDREALADCVAPTSVTTVDTDPDGDGPLEAGVYTRVAWDSSAIVALRESADLAPQGSFRIQYVAAVPMFSNVAADLDPTTANLVNNTGVETADEQQLVNGAVATGSTGGTARDSWDTHTVTAEDIAIQKSVDQGTSRQRAESIWTLDVQTGEYTARTSTVTVVDRLPAALVYVEGSTTGAPQPSVSAGDDGEQVLTWTLPAFTAPSLTAQIQYRTTTLIDYRDSDAAPIAAGDSWTNEVALTTTADIITVVDGVTTERSGVELGDDSSAGQSTASIELTKDVAVRAANVAAGCDAVTDAQWDPERADGFAIGDTVCWRIAAQFQPDLHTLDVRIRDLLPAGFRYESWAPTVANTVPIADEAFVAPAADALQGANLAWNLGTVEPGLRFEAVIRTTVVAGGTTTGDITANLAKLSYVNTVGQLFQLRDQADAELVAPLVTIDKRSDVTRVHGGDTVTYTVTVANAGQIPVAGLSVRDVLPAGIGCDLIGGGGACSRTPDDRAAQQQWDGIAIAAGGTWTTSYTVQVPNTFAPGTPLVNTAGVLEYVTTTNTGGTTTHIPADNIDQGRRPLATPGTPAAHYPATVTVVGATVAKEVTGTGADEAGNDALRQATIGETIDYRVTATLPHGTTIANGVLVDTLPANVALVQVDGANAVATLAGATMPASAVTVSGRQLRVALPASYAVGEADQQLVVTLRVRVLDVSTNRHGTSLTNAAQLQWTGGSSSTARVGTTVVEPLISVAKTVVGGATTVSAGQPITYEIAVANQAGRATAHDVTVVDRMPQDVTPLGTNGEALTADGETSTGGAWDHDLRTITWTLDTVVPGTTTRILVPAVVSNPITNGATFTNEVTVVGRSTPGTNTDGRDDETDQPGYEDGSEVVVDAPRITLAKSATPGTARVGETIEYTLTVTVPANTRSFDTTVVDTLPAGVVYAGGAAIEATGDAAIGMQTFATEGEGGTIAFFLGDIAAEGADRTITITSTGYAVADVAPGTQLRNTAVVGTNLTDEIVGAPDTLPDEFDSTTPIADATVEVLAPSLSLVKEVQAAGGAWVETRRAKPGDELVHRIVVTNSGSSPAYDVVVDDALVVADPLERYEDRTDLTQAGGIDVSTPEDGAASWTIAGPIEPGQSVTITYAATVPETWDETQAVSGAEIVNRASAAGHDLPEETRGQHLDRDYEVYPTNDDDVSIHLDLASIGDTVWYDVNGDGVVDVDEPRLASIPVTVTYLGTDGVPGGGDDETYSTTTDERGEWIVEHLPAGAYVVTVDAAAVATAVPGLVPSHDGPGQIGAPDGVWTGSLAETDARRDVDIAFRGVGAVGDLVWFDQDRDGEQGAGEAGIPGVRLEIAWEGVEGVLAPVTRTVETNASGVYGLDGLPLGAVTVTVLDSEALGTYLQVSARSNDTLDGTSQTVLTAAEPVDLDLDLGYAGSHSIGDDVWLDQDGDGVRQPTESGLAGVEIALTFTDLRGVESTVSTRTDADGRYGFDGLPAGSYEVRVVNELLGSVESTSPRGREDGAIAGVIADGDAPDLTVDFGYRAESLVGQQIWLDLDGDGVRSEREPGIQGVTVTATGPNGATVTTRTDAQGRYQFEDLLPGTWTVTVGDGLPAGVTQTFDADGVGTPGASTFTLDPAVENGMQDLVQDFGYRGSAALGDTVWLDLDGDGVQGAGEPGLEGVTVTLTWQRGEGLEDVVLTTVTSADGTYAFTDLPAGTYVVRTDAVDAIDGIAPTYDLDGGLETPGDGGTVTLATGESRTDVDFGYRGSASIGDLVWLDRDGDGSAEGELGIAGVTVSLTWPRGGELGDVVLATVTDADGGYAFEHLPAGTYVVRLDGSTLPAGVAATHDEDGMLDGATTVTVAEGDVHDTADFGYRGVGSIGDRVWVDRNGDGVQDAGEPGAPGQTVELTWQRAGDLPDLVFTTITGEDGRYAFDGLPDGDLVVRIVGGIVDTAANTGNPQPGRSDASADLVLGDEDGRSRDDQDFGFQGAGTIGDLVWWDDDANGVRDETEPGLPGVTVGITWFGPDGVPGTADDVRMPDVVTDADGAYLLEGLPSGAYLVAVGAGIPAGLAPTVDAGDAESPDGVSTVTLDPTVDGGTVRLDQDFGYAGSGAIGDLVWLDLDGDGERQDGEPGLEGVQVTLTWAGVDGELGTDDDRAWTTTVGDDGSYGFVGLPAGTFQVTLDGVPAGLVVSADPDGGEPGSTVTLEPGESNLDADFGFVGDAGVGDTIWLDVDGNGVQGEREPGAAGVTVTVTSPGVDGELGTDDDLVVTVVTDVDGRYGVEGLPAGDVLATYDAATLPAGTAPAVDGGTGEPATGSQVALEPGVTRDDVDFPVLGTQALEGVVWVDADGDGVRDGGEPGIPGVTVIVTWEGPLGPIALEVVTDAEGAWSLPDVPAGDWSVHVDLDTVPERLVGSTPRDVALTVTVGGTGATEHGFVPTGAIGDLVFHDEDRDGVQDAGEAGIGGVAVQLLDAAGRVVVETTTAADGSYLFDDVAPGRYTVRIDMSTVPDGYVVTVGESSIDVEVGPAQSVLTADFPLAAPVVAPLPRTGGELALALLGVTLLLLLAGAALVLAARGRRA